MTCKYCNKEDAQWPTNYTPGCKMIEMDTGTIHTRERCDEIKTGKSKPTGWIKEKCVQCGVITNYNRKHFKKIIQPCRECREKKFNNLDNYGISL